MSPCGCRNKKTGRTSTAKVICAGCGTKLKTTQKNLTKWGSKPICPRCVKTYEKLDALKKAGMIENKKQNNKFQKVKVGDK